MVGTGVTELRTIWALLNAELRSRALVIDIKDVMLISQEGENVLLQLINHGAKLRPEGVLAKGLMRQLARRSKKRLGELIDVSSANAREEGMQIVLPHKNKISLGKGDDYATCHDFKRLFINEMNSCYRLAYTLTGDNATAEQCFVAALDDCVNGPSVLKHSIRWWARRKIIHSAIRTIRPRATVTQITGHASRSKGNERETGLYSDAAMTVLRQLPDFQRFVFVMSFLERYFNEDSSMLLGCTVAEVRDGQTEALRQIARAHAKNGTGLAATPSGAAVRRMRAV
jgi:DNA-directed RNA polymerase specialized sigma24 family protein